MHNFAMGIHQLSATYQPEDDRLLLRIRTHADELIECWWTRRMTQRLLPALQKLAVELSVSGTSARATVLPEARDMVAQGARQRSRQQADFQTVFNDGEAARPLGESPLLITAAEVKIDRTASPAVVRCTLRDAQQRSVTLKLDETLLYNTLALLETAVRQADWGLDALTATSATSPADPPDRASALLN